MPDIVVDQQVHAHASARAGVPAYVVMDDDEPVGLVLFERLPGQDHVVDLDIAAHARGRGLATAALLALLDPTRVARVEVATTNAPARRLYEKLGFEEAASDGVHLTLRRVARPATG